MPFTPNIVFTSLIKINGRLREFNFRKRTDTRFETDTNDERGNRYFFDMIKMENDSWQLQGDALPDWLTQHESMIGNAINEKNGVR